MPPPSLAPRSCLPATATQPQPPNHSNPATVTQQQPPSNSHPSTRPPSRPAGLVGCTSGRGKRPHCPTTCSPITSWPWTHPAGSSTTKPLENWRNALQAAENRGKLLFAEIPKILICNYLYYIYIYMYNIYIYLVYIYIFILYIYLYIQPPPSWASKVHKWKGGAATLPHHQPIYVKQSQTGPSPLTMYYYKFIA